MLFLETKSTSATVRPRGTGSLVPRQLLSEEVLHPGLTNELRVCARKPKRIRQPSSLAAFPEAGLKVALPVQELANQGLARRHVSIVLDPRAANEVERALKDLLLDTFKKRRIQLNCMVASDSVQSSVINVDN